MRTTKLSAVETYLYKNSPILASEIISLREKRINLTMTQARELASLMCRGLKFEYAIQQVSVRF